MAHRPRIGYSAEQKAEMWDRCQRGESLNAIGRLFDRPSSSIFGQLLPCGDIRPPPRRRSRLALTLVEREEISRGVFNDLSLRSIATQLGRTPSTICRDGTVNLTKESKFIWAKGNFPFSWRTKPVATSQAINFLATDSWQPDGDVGQCEKGYESGCEQPGIVVLYPVT